MRLVILALAMACGSSSKPATGARCTASKQATLELALAVARETYDVAQVDIAQATFVTRPNWYTPDGKPRDEAALADGDLRAGLHVAIDDTPTWHVAPLVERYRIGGLIREVIAPGQPGMPAWALGMADGLSADIGKRATTRRCE